MAPADWMSFPEGYGIGPGVGQKIKRLSASTPVSIFPGRPLEGHRVCAMVSFLAVSGIIALYAYAPPLAPLAKDIWLDCLPSPLRSSRDLPVVLAISYSELLSRPISVRFCPSAHVLFLYQVIILISHTPCFCVSERHLVDWRFGELSTTIRDRVERWP